jgi:hypothetical protein
MACMTRSLIRRSMSASDVTVTTYSRCHMVLQYNAAALKPYIPPIAIVPSATGHPGLGTILN